MSQNNGSTTQTTSATGPSWALPYQQNAQNQAYSQFNGVNSPTQLVAPFSPQQNQAITGITNLAGNGGTGSLNSAENYSQSVLNGNPAQNPYLSSEFNLGANDVQNRLESEFAGSGRNVIGSLPIQSDEMNNLATQLYGGAYNTGVQQQENAAALAPTLNNTAFGNQQTLFNTGGAVQSLAQNYIQAPQTFLQNYLNQVNQVPGQSVTTSQPMSPAQQAALTGTYANIGSGIGSTLGGMFGGSGSTIGGLLGALGGALA